MEDEEIKNTSQKRVKSLKDVKMVPIPERIKVPHQIPALNYLYHQLMLKEM